METVHSGHGRRTPHPPGPLQLDGRHPPDQRTGQGARARHPEAHIAFLVKRQFAPLVSDSPRLSEVLTYADGEPLLPLARELRARRFTHLLDLHGSLRSRALHWLVPGNWHEYSKRR